MIDVAGMYILLFMSFLFVGSFRLSYRYHYGGNCFLWVHSGLGCRGLGSMIRLYTSPYLKLKQVAFSEFS